MNDVIEEAGLASVATDKQSRQRQHQLQFKKTRSYVKQVQITDPDEQTDVKEFNLQPSQHQVDPLGQDDIEVQDEAEDSQNDSPIQKQPTHKKQKSHMDKAFLQRLLSPRNDKASQRNQASAVSVVKPAQFPQTVKNSHRNNDTERKFDFGNQDSSRPNR